MEKKVSKAMTLFDSPKLSVPAHIAKQFGGESNIPERATVPSLSYEGKVWTVSQNGEKTKLMKRTEDGDEMPMPVMRVVVLDYAKRRGRAYYEGAYDPAKPGTPLCWSDDGVVPHAGVQEPPAKSCEKCPFAVKGSKVTEQGKAISACSQHRMLVVVPAGKLDGQPLRMKLAITSDYDKNSPELEAQGWFAFSNFTDMLRTKGVQHTAALVTKMRFDPNTAYPKVMFSPDRWLEADEVAVVAPLTKSDEVKKLLSGTYTPAGADGKLIANEDDEEDAAPPRVKPAQPFLDDEAPAPKKKAAPAAKKPAPVIDADDEDFTPPKFVQKEAAKPVAEPVDDEDDEVPAPKKKAPAKVAMDLDDDEAPAPKKKAAPEKAAAPVKAAKAVSEDIDDLLAEWDE